MQKQADAAVFIDALRAETTVQIPTARKPGRQMKPRNMALAMRVWQDCQLHGWYRTIHEIADSIDAEVPRLVQVLQLKKWTGRIKRIQIENIDVPLKTIRTDEALEGICGDTEWTGRD